MQSTGEQRVLGVDVVGWLGPCRVVTSDRVVWWQSLAGQGRRDWWLVCFDIGVSEIFAEALEPALISCRILVQHLGVNNIPWERYKISCRFGRIDLGRYSSGLQLSFHG